MKKGNGFGLHLTRTLSHCPHFDLYWPTSVLVVQVISSELIRNLCLTMAAVLVVTLVLISDLVTVFWVFTCIAFTLIDLLGLMYFWGLTIEISSSIIVILAAGLAIDYAAHIGHTFTTVRGSKSRKGRSSLFLSSFSCFHYPDSSFSIVLWCPTRSYTMLKGLVLDFIRNLTHSMETE